MSGSKSDYYTVKEDVNLPFRGSYVLFKAGEPVPKNHPIFKEISSAAVKEHFGETTGFGRFDVEQATAAPGEKRGSKPTTTSPTSHGGKKE